MTAIFVCAFSLSGADPFLHRYSWPLALGTVGYSAIVCATSIAVLRFFLKSQTDEGVLQTIVAPAVAAVGCAAATYLALSNYGMLTAGSGGVAGRVSGSSFRPQLSSATSWVAVAG